MEAQEEEEEGRHDDDMVSITFPLSNRPNLNISKGEGSRMILVVVETAESTMRTDDGLSIMHERVQLFKRSNGFARVRSGFGRMGN